MPILYGMRLTLTLSFTFFLLFIQITTAFSSSHMGADITYSCIGANQYQVRLKLFRDCAEPAPSPTYMIDFSSASCAQSGAFVVNQIGPQTEVSQLCPASLPTSTCNGGGLPGVEEWIYEGTITLPMACTDWVLSFRDSSRNTSVTNLVSPSTTFLYVETTLDNVAASCNNSPVFSSSGVFYVPVGQPSVYAVGASDPDGDSLSFSLVPALDNNGVPVTYTGGLSGTNPLNSVPAVSLDPANGNLGMLPVGAQNAVVSIMVDEFRNGVRIGSVQKDVELIIFNVPGINSPQFNPVPPIGLSGGTQVGPTSFQVCSGDTLTFDIVAEDVINVLDAINMNWDSILGASFLVSGTNPVTGTFSWTPTVADSGFHTFAITARDNGCPILAAQILAVDIFVFEGTSAGPDTTYCTSGSPVGLTAVGGTNFTWSVISGDAGSLSCTNCRTTNVSPSVPTTYEVMGNPGGGCGFLDTIFVDTTSGCFIFPLDGLQLTGRNVDEAYTQLTWETINKENVGEFRIERSWDGATFDEIGIVQANGAIAGSATYDFRDDFPRMGTNVYRIAALDIDGKVAYSNLIKVLFQHDPSSLISVYPNPSSGEVNFHFLQGQEGVTKLIIYDLMGQEVLRKELPHSIGGELTIPVDMSNFSAGNYIYKLEIGNRFFNGRLDLLPE